MCISWKQPSRLMWFSHISTCWQLPKLSVPQPFRGSTYRMCVGLSAAASDTATGTCFSPACGKCLQQSFHSQTNTTYTNRNSKGSRALILIWQKESKKHTVGAETACPSPPKCFTSANHTVILRETTGCKQSSSLCPGSKCFMLTEVFS